jgi:20S proteasome alpha/beta subunit
MGTVVALESRGGVAIAGDRLAVEGETVASQRARRVFDFGTVGAGVVGETGDIQAFRRRLEDELRTVRTDNEGEVGIDKLARIAARQAREANVSAAVVTRDSDGIARLREVGPDGQVFENSLVALGVGAELAFGQLEAIDPDIGADEAASAVADILEIVAKRDTSSGDDIDVWSLSSSPAGENGEEA